MPRGGSSETRATACHRLTGLVTSANDSGAISRTLFALSRVPLTSTRPCEVGRPIWMVRSSPIFGPSSLKALTNRSPIARRSLRGTFLHDLWAFTARSRTLSSSWSVGRSRSTTTAWSIGLNLVRRRSPGLRHGTHETVDCLFTVMMACQLLVFTLDVEVER